MTEKPWTLIEDIATWDYSRCLDVWITLTGTAPGSRLSLRFLRKALIFEQQRKELGGHSAAIRRRMRAGTKPVSTHTQTLTLGSQLVREWNGRIYQVKVTADGFEMDGQRYSSLSAVAKRITGTDWSGPRFFGIKERKS